MGITLPTVDLSTLTVGQAGTIDLTSMQISAHPSYLDNPAHIRLYNESGSGLQIAFQTSGYSDFIPAGAWSTYALVPGESAINFVITYKLPNPPIQTLIAIFYQPFETVPNSPILGNSPIGLSGSVGAIVNALSNENNAVGTEVIDIGTAAHNKLLDIFNDHFVWAIEQSGVSHQVLKGQTSASPLLIGATGDTSEVAGSLLVDQNINMLNNIFMQWKDTGGTLRAVMAVDSANNVKWLGITGKDTFLLQTSGGLNKLRVDANGITLLNADNIRFNNAAGTAQNIFTVDGSNNLNVNDAGGGVTQFKSNGTNTFQNTSTGPNLNANMTYKFLVGSMSKQNGNQTACGSGTTISHGMGATPVFVLGTPLVTQPGSGTVGVGSIGASTFTATIGAGSTICWWAVIG